MKDRAIKQDTIRPAEPHPFLVRTVTTPAVCRRIAPTKRILLALTNRKPKLIEERLKLLVHAHPIRPSEPTLNPFGVCFALKFRMATDARARRSWSDSSTRRVEKTLGSVVLALEGELAAQRQRTVEAEERRRLAAEEERRREEERQRERDREAVREHREALAKDLRAKASAWSEAQEVRAFVRAVADSIPPEARDATLDEWLTWAEEHARTLDPLSQPNAVAKPLAPPHRAQATSARS